MGKDKSPAFQLYAADFFVDTAGWTAAQVGAYFRLLLAEWVNGPLSSNMSDLARIAGVSDPRTMYKMWKMKIEKKFILNNVNLLYNKRLEQERENQAKRRELQVQKGISGANKRWENHIATAIAQAQPKDSSSSSSSSSNKEKNITTIADYAEIAKSAVANSLKENREIWQKAFPAVNLDTESSKALSWLLANPKNKKSNFKRFLNNWFMRAQDRAPRVESQTKSWRDLAKEF